jgi:hypothetical protein
VLGIVADQQRGLDSGKMSEQTRMPEGRAFSAGRLVAAARFAAGITKTHRQDRHAAFVVESRLVEPHPVAQTIAADIVPRYPGLMGLPSKGLSDDQQPGGASKLRNWPRAKWEGGFAGRAHPDMTQQEFSATSRFFGPRLTPEKNASKDDGIVVEFIACAKDQCYGPPAGAGAECSKFLRMTAQLRRIAAAELRPTRRTICAMPCSAQYS